MITYTLILKFADEKGFLSRLTNMSEGRIDPLRAEEMMLAWPEAEA